MRSAVAVTALAALVLPFAASAEPPPKALIVTVNSTDKLQMTSQKPIKTVFNENETVARVSPMMGDPTTVLVIGLNPGFTRITLVAADGGKEVHQLGKAPAR